MYFVVKYARWEVCTGKRFAEAAGICYPWTDSHHCSFQVLLVLQGTQINCRDVPEAFSADFFFQRKTVKEFRY